MSDTLSILSAATVYIGLMAATSDNGPVRHAPLLVVGPAEADCDCDYDADQAAGANNAACVTVAFVELPSQQAKCETDNPEVCGTAQPCTGTISIQTQINNWGQCCGGNILTCLNGGADQLIPHSYNGTINTTAGGTKLACQANSDSFDLPGKIDTFTLICGSSCAGAPLATFTFTDYCYACPAGGGDV